MIESPDHDDPSHEEEIHENSGKKKFLSRWSRRKQSAQQNKITAKTIAAPESLEPVEPIPLNTITPSTTTGRMLTTVEADQSVTNGGEENQQETALTDEDMPEIEELGEGSDYSGFMSPGVSDRLRKMALRKLFAGAGFNIRDGLDDYDDDFTNFPALGDIVTCDMKHQMELAEERKRKAEELADKERIELSEQGKDAAVQETEQQQDQLKTDDPGGNNLEQDGSSYDDPERDKLKPGNESIAMAEDSTQSDQSVDKQQHCRDDQTRELDQSNTTSVNKPKPV